MSPARLKDRILIQRLIPMLVFATASACGDGGSGGTIAPPPVPVPPPTSPVLDIAALSANDGLIRLSGSASTGRFGVPVASGADCDGDGHQDFAMSGMQASPFGRTGAGQVWLNFGDGTIGADIDSATNTSGVLFAGAGRSEAAGGEIWMDDVTGDGLGDLLIGRQNFRHQSPDRIGAGALTIVAGGPALRNFSGRIVDLAAPPPELSVMTIAGAAELDRLGFWMRTGDVSGDGIADILVGADQADVDGDVNAGLAYLVRGGAHLASNTTVDLAAVAGSFLEGHLITVKPPANSTDYHFGATVSVADLDGNERGELLIAASLSRVGGLLVADGAPVDSAVRNGGNLGGSLFIIWDDNIPQANPWPTALTLETGSLAGGVSRIDGGEQSDLFANERFGEDILGGEDYDVDGTADLFVGDIRGDTLPGGTDAGLGHIFFDADSLRDQQFSVSNVPVGIRMTTVLGENGGVIFGDTSMQGDIDGDGTIDLALASPLASPESRSEAGVIHVLWGQGGPWPETIALAPDRRPDPASFAISDIFGGSGTGSSDDQGDTLMYSAASGDLNADGNADLIVNEMRGNGVAPDAIDVGNLLVIDGTLIER